MKKVILFIGIIGVLIGCNRPDNGFVESISTEKTSEATQELPEMSIYNLPSNWTTQNNEQIELKDLRGNVVVMVMIYTSCKAACPRLVADMRNIERQFSKKELENIKLVMVSIDPETDTPEVLNRFAKDNLLGEDHWMLLRGTPSDTREFAAVLAVSYKQISPIDFSHSNIISVFNEEGVLVHQLEGLGVDNDETIAAIKKEISN